MSGPKHLATRSRRSAGQRVLVGGGAVLSLLLFSAATVLGYFNYKYGQIDRYDVSIDVAPDSGKPRNYLIVGSDSREGLDPTNPDDAQYFEKDGSSPSAGTHRTDTIMVLRVDPKEGKASLLSFPRDLWVTISDTGKHNRINVAFAHGREVLVDTIRENFGIPIHHYVEVDFVGFLGLVNAIGGVPMYFSDPVRDSYSQLHVNEPGCVTLDGRQALAFARSRHLEIQNQETGRWRDDPSGDFGRISRQQVFIRKAIKKAVSRGLTNPATLNQLVNVGVDYVGLDPTLTVGDLLSLGRKFAAFDADSLNTYSLPATPFRTSAGASVLDLDERKAEPILNVFRGLDPDAVTPGVVGVTVLNGTGESGLAGDVTAALDQIGFATDTPGDTDQPFDHTTIYYAPGSEQAAITLARHVSGEVAFGTDEDLGENEVVLVAGHDFTTLHDQPSPTTPSLPTTTTTTAAPGKAGSSTSAPPPTTTTTAPLGYTPDEAPAGVSCG